MSKQKHSTHSDSELDKIANFRYLYDSNYVYLCAIATKYVYNPEIAKEIVNDVFITIWNKSPIVDSSIAAYLRKAVQNKCLNYIRDRHIQSIPFSEAENELLAIREKQLSTDDHPLANLENKELKEIIKTAIDTLPCRCKEVFYMYLYHDKSYDEIAEELSISSSTVRGQIKIGLAKLKDQLEDINPFLYIIMLALLNHRLDLH